MILSMKVVLMIWASPFVNVSNKSIGFDSEFNEVTIFYKNNKKEKLFVKSKSLISDEIIQRVNNQLN